MESVEGAVVGLGNEGRERGRVPLPRQRGSAGGRSGKSEAAADLSVESREVFAVEDPGGGRHSRSPGLVAHGAVLGGQELDGRPADGAHGGARGGKDVGGGAGDGVEGGGAGGEEGGEDRDGFGRELLLSVDAGTLGDKGGEGGKEGRRRKGAEMGESESRDVLVGVVRKGEGEEGGEDGDVHAVLLEVGDVGADEGGEGGRRVGRLERK